MFKEWIGFTFTPDTSLPSQNKEYVHHMHIFYGSGTFLSHTQKATPVYTLGQLLTLLHGFQVVKGPI